MSDIDLRRAIEALFYRVSREGPEWIARELGYLLPVYPNPTAQQDAAALRREQEKAG